MTRKVWSFYAAHEEGFFFVFTSEREKEIGIVFAPKGVAVSRRGSLG
jgi:hypothetical protein